MQTWMLTGPRTIHKRVIQELFRECDVKKFIIAKETGKNGYEHWQIRCTASRPDFYDYCHDREPRFHIEKANTDNQNYERKDGNFISSEDTCEILKVRFGKLGDRQEHIWQKQLIKRLKKQTVREIDVVLDPSGNKGKSFATINLWERGKALVVPRTQTTAEKVSGFICSAWKGEEIIIIDIPRSGKPSKSLYETLEEIKDGLVFDWRYAGRTRNIRGTKLVVFTNEPLNLKGLSDDRWVLHGIRKDGTLS